VISAALKVMGNLESAGEIQIDGKVEGDVRGLMVKVGEGASIKGSVFGDSVELAGTVEGKIEAKAVVINRTGHMTGDIIHESLQIEQGAHVDGHCRPTYGKSEAAGLQSRRGAPASHQESVSAERRVSQTGNSASISAT
jgi:cytoskeletal protein CcmA (bactofilin family)